MSNLISYVLILAAFIETIQSQCVISPECLCVFRTNANLLYCVKKVKNLTEFINLKFNSNLTSFEYDIIIANKNYTILPDFIFRGIKIQSLDMQYNEIEYISNWTFSDIIKIQSLILDNNKIKFINNLISSLSINSFKPNQINPTLSTLSIKSNKIETIDTKFTKTFSKLTKIYLNDNLIRFVKANVFENLKELAEVRLDDNLLESISNGSLFGPSKYETLYFSYNNLLKLEALFVQNISFVPKVDFKIYLHHSNIEEIENFAFNYYN